MAPLKSQLTVQHQLNKDKIGKVVRQQICSLSVHLVRTSQNITNLKKRPQFSATIFDLIPGEISVLSAKMIQIRVRHFCVCLTINRKNVTYLPKYIFTSVISESVHLSFITSVLTLKQGRYQDGAGGCNCTIYFWGNAPISKVHSCFLYLFCTIKLMP